MYCRILAAELKILAGQFRTVTVVGPRQAGKSTLCRHVFPDYGYASLEDPDVRAFAQEDPRAFLAAHRRRTIFDEIQRVPTLLAYLQGIVDRDAEMGQFVLTGSHQLDLQGAVAQSLAGRTARVTLLPLSCEELPRHGRSAAQCVWEGGMPGRHADAVDVARYDRSYFQTYVERDVRLLLQVKDLSLFEKFLRMCAGRVGRLLVVSALASDVGISPHTAEHWLSVLEASFIVLRLPPYFHSFGKRLTKMSKPYFVDVGLAARLLGIQSAAQAQRDPLWGGLFENLVVLEAYKARLNRGRDPDLYFFRDGHGREVDLVAAAGRQLHAVEIKAAQTFDRSFLRGLDYFAALAGEAYAGGTVAYAGEQRRCTDAYTLLPFEQLGAALP